MRPIASFIAGVVLCAALCLSKASVAPSMSLVPKRNAVFTATNEVSSLALEGDGTLWVGTTGGILRRDKQGKWRKWTRQDGLPAHETRRITLEQGVVTAAFPTATVAWREGRWNPSSAVASLPTGGKEPRLCTAEWNGKPCMASLTALRVKDGADWFLVPVAELTRHAYQCATAAWRGVVGRSVREWDLEVRWQRVEAARSPSASRSPRDHGNGGERSHTLDRNTASRRMEI